jgi:hypothetical protein
LADRVVKRSSIEFIYHGLTPNTLDWIHKKVKASNARELESETRQRKASSHSCFFFFTYVLKKDRYRRQWLATRQARTLLYMWWLMTTTAALENRTPKNYWNELLAFDMDSCILVLSLIAMQINNWCNASICMATGVTWIRQM